MQPSPRQQFLRAKERLAVAEDEVENASKASDAISDEMRVARTGLAYARREMQNARENYAAATRAELRAQDPAFAALSRRADDARAAADAAIRLFRAVRDVYHAARAAKPEGFRDVTQGSALEEGARAYGRITHRVFRLHGEALAEVKGDLETLERLATDLEGQVEDAFAAHALASEVA